MSLFFNSAPLQTLVYTVLWKKIWNNICMEGSWHSTMIVYTIVRMYIQYICGMIMYKAVWKCEKKVNGQEAAYWNAVLRWPGWGILLDDLYGPKFAATAYIHDVISGHTKWAICLQDMLAVPLFRDKSGKCDMSWVSLRKNPEFPFLFSSCSWMLLGSVL